MATTVNNNNIESKNGVNNSHEEIKVGTEVWTTIELHEEYGKLGKVVRRFFADHGVWCLDIEFEDGTTACYAEEYVTTEKPWAVVGAKCRHKYLNRDVVLTITAVGQYYGIKAESEDGKVKRYGLVRDFEPVEDGKAEKAASGIKDDSFFTNGKKYRCIKSVVMKKGGKTVFKAGSIYEQTNDPTHWVGWLRNEQGERHAWPQPVYIADEVKTWGTKPEDIDPRLYFEPVEDVKETEFSDTLTDDLKEGDRVLSRHYGAQATVLGREWDKQRKAWYYRVQFDTMQRHMDGSEFNVTEFHRDGLTKNYDHATGRERVGNAEYYRETLLAEFWGNDRTPRTVYGMEIFKPTDRRPSWLVVADIFSEPKEMTLREVCDMLAARYQEEQGKAA